MNIPKAHQRIIREASALSDGYGLFGEWWKQVVVDRSSAEVKICKRRDVASLITTYEWLGNVPDNCSAYTCLTFGGVIAGALAFSKSGFGGGFTLLGNEAWKLSRGVTVHWAPNWASSFLIQRSLKLLFDRPLIVVAFTDWQAGEIGTIYQACGWTYLGCKRALEWRTPKGERRDASIHKVRVVSGSRHVKSNRQATVEQFRAKAAKMRSQGWTMSKVMRGKYATVAGPKGRERRRLQQILNDLAHPYPKRSAVEVSREIHDDSIIEGAGQFCDAAPEK